MIRNLFQYLSDKQSRAAGLMFITMSFLVGTWFARIPEIKEKLGLEDDTLGLALLGMGLGGLFGGILAGVLASKLKLGQMNFWSSIALCFTVNLPIYAIGWWSLFLTLFLVGLSNGFLNVAMNTAAGEIEKKDDRHILSTSHGMFSFGLGMGALTSGWMAQLGISFDMHMLGVTIILALISLITYREIHRFPNTQTAGTGFSLPPASLLLVALLCFAFGMTEGAINDWGSLFMQEIVQSTEFAAGFALFTFAMGMAIGRFNGDNFRQRFAGKKIILWGGVIGGLALLLIVIIPSTYISIPFFFIMGLGVSIATPILYMKGADAPGIAPGIGLASVATFGTMGFLLGPPFIGFLADSFDLAIGLGFVALLTFVAGVGALKLKG